MTASAGQVVPVPVQVSAMSHPPETAARHTVPAFPAGCVQATEPTVPLHTSVVQTLPSSVHAVPTALTASAGQVVLVPVQVSARSHSLTAARHTAPAFPDGCVQAGESRVSLHTSVVQGLPSSVQADPAALTASAGQVVLVPVQVSARSHSLTVARHTVPAWPAGCVQRGLPTVPLQVSVVRGLPSSVQADPDDLTALAGQLVLLPVQVSARSHSLTAARHTVPAWPAGCVQRGLLVLPLHVSVVQTLPSSVQAVPADLTVVGQVVLVPVQVWSRSHSLGAVWHVVPALPPRCWASGLLVLPLHVSVVQTLPSSVQAVPASLTAVGQVGLVPGQVSVRSRSLVAVWHTVPAGLSA